MKTKDKLFQSMKGLRTGMAKAGSVVPSEHPVVQHQARADAAARAFPWKREDAESEMRFGPHCCCRERSGEAGAPQRCRRTLGAVCPPPCGGFRGVRAKGAGDTLWRRLLAGAVQ